MLFNGKTKYLLSEMVSEKNFLDKKIFLALEMKTLEMHVLNLQILIFKKYVI